MKRHFAWNAIFSPRTRKLWYLFEGRYAVEFTEDGLRIIHDLSFHDDKAKHGCPGEMPCQISIDILPAARVRDCLVGSADNGRRADFCWQRRVFNPIDTPGRGGRHQSG